MLRASGMHSAFTLLFACVSAAAQKCIFNNLSALLSRLNWAVGRGHEVFCCDLGERASSLMGVALWASEQYSCVPRLLTFLVPECFCTALSPCAGHVQGCRWFAQKIMQCEWKIRVTFYWAVCLFRGTLCPGVSARSKRHLLISHHLPVWSPEDPSPFLLHFAPSGPV